MPAADFRAILRALAEHGVEFIVVGGIGAVLQGAPISTFDLDVVHSTDPENIGRLLSALKAISAFYRVQPERRIEPTASHLSSPEHQLLMTAFGPLDLLGSIGKDHRYADLLPHAVRMNIAAGLRVNVLELRTLIAVKEETAGEKDLAVLPLLRRTLEEKNRAE